LSNMLHWDEARISNWIDDELSSIWVFHDFAEDPLAAEVIHAFASHKIKQWVTLHAEVESLLKKADLLAEPHSAQWDRLIDEIKQAIDRDARGK